jgi:hypothetical protein
MTEWELTVFRGNENRAPRFFSAAPRREGLGAGVPSG